MFLVIAYAGRAAVASWVFFFAASILSLKFLTAFFENDPGASKEIAGLHC